MEEVVISCIGCGLNFTTYWMISDGMPIELFCSNSCGDEYYSRLEIRNRKLKLILK